jgi:hypothetical protein
MSVYDLGTSTIRRPKPKVGCCDTIQYIIPVTGKRKTKRLPSNKTDLNLARFEIASASGYCFCNRKNGGKKLRQNSKTLEK